MFEWLTYSLTTTQPSSTYIMCFKSAFQNLLPNFPQQIFWRAPFWFVIENRVAFLNIRIPFWFSILRTVVAPTLSFAAVARIVVGGLAMVSVRISLFSMLRSIFPPRRTFFRIGLFTLDSSRIRTNVHFEHTDLMFSTTNLNTLWS